MNESEKQTRESSGFLIKQRAFLKLYLITELEKCPAYGLQLLETLQNKFNKYGYDPNHAEIYRSLYELADDGYLDVRQELAEGARRKKHSVYSIKDKEKTKAYKKLVKADLDRCDNLLRQAIEDNFA